MTPLMSMHSLGHSFVPAPIHAGGLRYHGVAPLISRLALDDLVEPQAFDQLLCYGASVQWARTEGFVSTSETSHALTAVLDEKKRRKRKARSS
jgi:tryptophan synthase beta chain